jgi:flagellar biogenesis protein FliO
MTPEAPSFGAQLAGTALALAFVLALAWGALKGLQRLQRRAEGAAPGQQLQVLSSVAVGPRERVVALRWQGRTLLVGVAAGGVTLLDAGPAPDGQGAP